MYQSSTAIANNNLDNLMYQSPTFNFFLEEKGPHRISDNLINYINIHEYSIYACVVLGNSIRQ